MDSSKTLGGRIKEKFWNGRTKEEWEAKWEEERKRSRFFGPIGAYYASAATSKKRRREEVFDEEYNEEVRVLTEAYTEYMEELRREEERLGTSKRKTARPDYQFKGFGSGGVVVGTKG